MAEVNSGKASSRTGGAPNKDTAYFEFRWSSKNIGAGQTQINWELWRCGRYSSPTRYEHSYTINIYQNNQLQQTLTKDWGDFDSDSNDYTFNDNKSAAKARSGTFIINHKNDGSATLKVQFSDVRIYYDVNLGSTERTFSIVKNYPYSNCGAPTSVTISAPRVKPGGNFTISWTGATAGTANAITGYRVEYKVGSGNWAVAATKNTTTSIVVTLPANSVRGANIIAQVKTLGTQQGYDSGFRTSSGDYKVNTLPNKPTVTVNKRIFASQEATQLKITATSGSDSDANQTLIVQYRVRTKAEVDNGTTGSIINYTGSIVKSPESGQYLYEFWTYDGLEYSTPEKFWVIKNPSKPTVKDVVVTGTALVSKNNTSGKTYIIAPTISWAKGENGWTNNSYRVGIRYSEKSDFSGYKNILVQESTTTSLTYSIPDVRVYIPISIETGYYYKIYVERYDGIEWGIGWSTDTYYVTKIPRICRVLNDKYGHPSTNDFNKFFLNELYFYFPYDQGYNQVDFVAKTGTNTKVGPATLSFWNDGNKNEYLLAKTTSTIIQSWARGQEYSIELKPKYKTSKSSYTPLAYQNEEFKNPLEEEEGVVKITRGRIKVLPTPSQLNASWTGVAKPFTASDQSITFLPFEGSTDENSTWYYNYGFFEKPSLTVVAKNATKTYTIGPFEYVHDGMNGSIQLPGENIYDLFMNIGLNISQISNYTIPISIETENYFGEKLIGQISKQVNFNEDFTIAPEKIYLNIDGKETLLCHLSDGAGELDFLKEGNIIRIKAGIESYHGVPNELKLQFASNINGEEQIIAEGVINSATDFELSEGAGHNKPAVYITNTQIITLPQITEQCEMSKIYVTATDARNQTKTNNAYDIPDNRNIIFERHTKAILKINEANYEEVNGVPTFRGTVTVDDLGFNPLLVPEYSYSVKFFYTDGATDIDITPNTTHSDLKNFSFEETTNSPIGNFTISHLELETSYSVNGSQTTYITRSEDFVIYNTIPTLGYRANQVGINYNLSSSPVKDSKIPEAAFVIGAHTGKDYIVFTGVNAGTVHEAFIKIATGEMNSFIIDGGSWDEI